MRIIESLGKTEEDLTRIRQDVVDIASSSKTLDEALHTMREKYEVESLIVGFLFYAGAFTTSSYEDTTQKLRMN